jgi:hypothetical protein
VSLSYLNAVFFLFFFCNANQPFFAVFPYLLISPDDAEACTSESYVGGYSANRCRTGCGGLSQALYKLPAALLVPSATGEGGGENSLVFLEEVGGSPAGVQLVTVTMSTITAK